MQFVPHGYQKAAIERLVSSERLALFQDMGLGKTVEVLTAIREMRMRWRVSRVLVVAPKKVAEATWTHEAEQWDHLCGMRISKVLGTLKQRTIALAAPADLYVINRENVQWLVD